MIYGESFNAIFDAIERVEGHIGLFDSNDLSTVNGRLNIFPGRYHPAGRTESCFYDATTQRLLTHQDYRLVFYLNGNRRHNRYINYMPKIPSSKIPYEMLGGDEFMIRRIETYTSDANTGELFSVRDKYDNYEELFYIDVGSPATKEYVMEDANIVISPGMGVCTKVLSTRVDNPAVILTMKRIVEL